MTGWPDGDGRKQAMDLAFVAPTSFAARSGQNPRGVGAGGAGGAGGGFKTRSLGL